MELRDLSTDEAACLLGLLREVIQADADYSEAERAEVAALREHLGGELFDRALEQARTRYAGNLHALKEDAKALARVEARASIYGVLKQVAASDGTTANEQKPLAWLASWWDLAR